MCNNYFFRGTFASLDKFNDALCADPLLMVIWWGSVVITIVFIIAVNAVGEV